MKIQILGTGCPKCKKTAEVMKEAAAKMGLTEGGEFEIEKLRSYRYHEIRYHNDPGVAIDGKVIASGRVPTISEATTMITNHLAAEGK